MYPQLTKTNQLDNIYSEQKMKEGNVVWIQLTTSSSCETKFLCTRIVTTNLQGASLLWKLISIATNGLSFCAISHPKRICIYVYFLGFSILP
jgi:hypothetical protein